MSRTPFVATALALAMALFVSAIPAQTPAPAVPPVDPTLPDLLKELKEWVADPKMVADFQAIGRIQKLIAVENRNPKDKERLAKGIGDVFRTGKVRTGDKEILYREAGDALAKLAADGAKELAKALGDARIKDAVGLQAHLILALGRTEDDKQVDFLVDTTTRSHHDELRAAAGEALGNYTSLDVKVRREVVKQLIRSWGSLHSKATEAESSDPSAPINLDPQNARRTLKAVEGKWVATLTRLTGVSQTGFADWQRWLNKNPNWNPPSAKKP
ncbi:MAG: hypothetical protein JNK15_07080 [Planctomycetes bacterium]|nr:hypothetical protein [Planctomycetota bacterium]